MLLGNICTDSLSSLHAEISSQIRLYDQVGISLCLDMGTYLHRRSITLCAEISPHPEYVTVCRNLLGNLRTSSLRTRVRIFPHFRTMSPYVEISAHSVWVRYHMKRSLHIQSVKSCKDISPFPDYVTVCRNLRTFSLRGKDISPYPDYVTVCGNIPISGTSLDIGKYLHRPCVRRCHRTLISGTSLIWGNICTEGLSPFMQRFLCIPIMSPYVEISPYPEPAMI